MDNLNDFKAIWLSAKVDGLPDSIQMEKVIKNYRDKKLRKLVLLIGTASFLVLLMLAISIFIHSKFMSTRIGEAFIILAAMLLIATNLNSFHRFYHLKVCSNKEYIAFLEQTRIRQLFYFKRTQIVCLVLMFIGLVLFIYEIIQNNILLAFLVYSFFIIYFSVMWFIVRPRTFKKEVNKLDEELENTRRIAKQFQ